MLFYLKMRCEHVNPAKYFERGKPFREAISVPLTHPLNCRFLLIRPA